MSTRQQLEKLIDDLYDVEIPDEQKYELSDALCSARFALEIAAGMLAETPTVARDD
jgi:hypothetical protein